MFIQTTNSDPGLIGYFLWLSGCTELVIILYARSKSEQEHQ